MPIENEPAFPGHPLAPRRRFKLSMCIHADDMDSLVMELQDFDECIRQGSHNVTSGGTSSGGHFTIDVDESMTPEKYEAELGAYVEFVWDDGSKVGT